MDFGNGYHQILEREWIAPVVCTLYVHECVDYKLLLDLVTARYIAQTASLLQQVLRLVVYFI